MDLHLAWSSETGNALDLMRQFIDQCRRQTLPISTVQQINQKIIFHEGIWIFFVSTTGDGSPPHSMRLFWKDFMKKSFKLPNKMMFSIYSLGDRSYGDNFGMTARKLRQRFKMLGAQQFREIGLGDDLDSQGYRQVFLNGWKQDIIHFCNQHVIKKEESHEPIQRALLRSRQLQSQFEIQQIQELSSHKERRVFWVRLVLLSEQLEVKQGDVIQIFPQNRPQDVEYLLNYFKKQANQPIQFNNSLIPLKQLLQSHLNISCLVNYYFFTQKHLKSLSDMTENLMYQQKLRQFAINYEQYFNFIRRYKRNVIQFIRDFQLKLDLAYLCDNIGQIIGRKYSIARIEGKRIWLLVKLVEDFITETRLYKGLCSHDLFRSKGQKRNCRIISSEIAPKQLRKNNIIIALGTGIAPFIWVLDQLQLKNINATLIYTNSYRDEIFHHQLVKTKIGDTFNEIISCTREGELRMIRLLQKQAERILTVIQQDQIKNCRIFYCGPKQIHQFITSFISKLMNIAVNELKKSKLIIYQNW